jgi:hypothetical protein
VGSVNASGAIEDNVTTSTLTLSTGSTVEFNGAAAQFIDTRTFSNLKINNTGGVTMVGDVVVNKNLDLQSDLAIDENFLTLKETTSYGSGLLIGTNLSVLDIQGSSALTATFKVGGQQLLWLNIDQTAGALSLGSPLTIADELSLVKSTSVLHNNIAETITLNGDLTGTGSYIGDGKILFTGNTDTSKVSGATLSNVEFDDTHHFELTGNTAFTGLLTLTNGHVIIGGNTLNLSGTISNASGVLRGSDSSNINILVQVHWVHYHSIKLLMVQPISLTVLL